MYMIWTLFGMCLFAGVVSVCVALKNSRQGRIEKPNVHKKALYIILICVVAPWTSSRANAQEVVHAATGTLTAGSRNDGTLSLKSDDGSITLFNVAATKQRSITFSREVEAETVAADTFHTIGAHVLIFYYGVGTIRTAVAIRDLGTADLERLIGRVTNFDKHRHVMTVDGSNSVPVDIVLSGDTIVDTPNGVMKGLKYHPNKSERIGAVIKSSEGLQTAVFISATGPNASNS